MNRINTSRQSIAATQRNCNYRPSGALAPHVLAASLVLEGIEQEVSYRIATEAMQVGDIAIVRGQGYYLVASKFACRYYVVVSRNGAWVSSSKDERAAVMHVAKVLAYRLAPVEEVA